jgi:acyl carrier protein
MTSMTDTEPIRRFIREHFRSLRDATLTDDQELYPGVIDSRGVVELADFVEESYSIRLSEEDLLSYAEHFRSLNTIAALIEQRRTQD